MLYATYQGLDDIIAPFRTAALTALSFGPKNPGPFGELFRRNAALMEMLSRFQLTHARPSFGIHSVRVENRDVPVTEEVALDQLPRRFEVRGHVLALDAKAVRTDDGSVDSLLVSVSDISALEAAQREAQRNGAIIAILSKKSAFSRFVIDARELLDEAGTTDDALLLRRLLHTVKGNAASWGLASVAGLIHEIEEQDTIADTTCTRSSGLDRRRKTTSHRL